MRSKAECGSKDELHVTAKGVWFDFSTSGGEDGFDFRLPGNSCIRIDSTIDGKPRPDRGNFGAADTHTKDAHVKLCP